MADIVIIREPEVPITISETDNPVSITAPGPQGATGPGGGGGGTVYEHIQAVAASSWVIDHDLDCEPDVTVIISGEALLTDVTYNTADQLTVTFASPQSGKARLRP